MTAVNASTVAAPDLTLHRIHPSLVRTPLFAGAEPAAAIVEASVAFALVFVVGLHWATLLLAGFWLTGVHSVMAWIAKQDPQMTTLYIRSTFARDYYPPHARIDAPAPLPKPSIPQRR